MTRKKRAKIRSMFAAGHPPGAIAHFQGIDRHEVMAVLEAPPPKAAPFTGEDLNPGEPMRPATGAERLGEMMP